MGNSNVFEYSRIFKIRIRQKYTIFLETPLFWYKNRNSTFKNLFLEGRSRLESSIEINSKLLRIFKINVFIPNYK